MDDIKVDLKLESVDESDEKFIFTAKSITKEFVCEKGLKRLAADSVNKPIVWRHEHPVNPKYSTTHIYGRVLESSAVDGSIISKYEVYGHTEEHEMIKELIRKRNEINKPISISMRFREYTKNKKPIHYDVIEHSLTPTPACEECVLIDIQNEGDIMPEKTDLEKQIEELEEKLTKKDKAYEKLQSRLIELEKTIESKDVELEDAKSSKKEYTEQLLEFKDKLNEQTSKIQKLEEDLFFKDIEPLVDRLVELDGEEMRNLYLGVAKEEKGKEFLLERIKKKEGDRPVSPQTTGLDKTAEEASVDHELEEDEKTKKERDSKAFMYMPTDFKKGD